MNVISEAKWMNAAKSGLRNPRPTNPDPQHVDCDRADKVLSDDPVRLPCDRHRLGKAREIVAEQDDIGAVARDIGA